MSTKVQPNEKVCMPREKGRPVGDEEAGSNSADAPADTARVGSRVKAGMLLAGMLVACLVVGLAVGLTHAKTEDTQESTTATAKASDQGTLGNPNMEIYDKALALLEATPRQTREISSGETLSYREYNGGKPHALVVLPGFMADDTMTSILAVLPEFADHRKLFTQVYRTRPEELAHLFRHELILDIISVNPRGWNGSTMNKPFASHEELAEDVMELMNLINIEKAMVMGLSSGGGIAFHLAQKYPDIFNAAFLVHALPLSGLKYLTLNNELVVLKSVEEVRASTLLPSEDPDFIYQLFKSMSSKPDHYIPKDHKLNEYFTEAALNMPGSTEASVANASFNVTPIKTPFASPNDLLADLKSKVIVLHGSNDWIVPWQIVEPVTKLAIAEQWAQGMLSLYDDGLSHMGIIDSPNVLAEVYRRALEEQGLV